MKLCKKCNKEKPLFDMIKNKRRPDGHSFICKQCYNIDQKEYQKEYQKGYNI